MSKLTANQIEELRADGPAIITDGSWQALCDMALASLDRQDAPREERAPVEAAGVGEPECVTVLRGYQQADADGVMVTASRQAIDETLTYLDTLRSALRGSYEALVSDLPGLIGALEHQKQCDADGIECQVNRQAVDEALTILRAIRAAALRERGKDE